MSGFGNGPFGNFPFGSAPWSRAVLFDALPGIYRLQDAEAGGDLERFTEGLRPSLDKFGSQITAWSNLRDPLTVPTQYSQLASLRLGKIRNPESAIEQRGVDGSVSVGRNFVSPTARFRPEDIGKSLTISGSTVPINNKTFKIASVVSPTTARCEPSPIADSSSLRWSLKGFPVIPEGELAIEIRSGDVGAISPNWTLSDGATEMNVLARNRFFPVDGETRALTETEGLTGIALSDGRFQAETSFTQQDVGKPFTVSGSTFLLNSTKSEIFAVDPSFPTKVRLDGPLFIFGATNGGVTYRYQPGHTGVRVTHIVAGISTPLTVSVAGSDITVNVATNGSGVATSTATAVTAAVNGNVFATVLVAATAEGSGVGVVGAQDFAFIPGTSLLTDPGPLVWAKLPFPQLLLATQAPPTGVVEQEGVDLVVSGAMINQVKALTARFTASDVGKLLVIRGSTLGSDGAYPIAAFVDPSNVQLTVGSTLSSESNLTWEVRTPSQLQDILRVEAHSPSLLEHLGADFALDLDNGATETQQRSWVENAIQWMNVKGAVSSYRILGSIGGFVATPISLYRIALWVSYTLPLLNVFVLRETDVVPSTAPVFGIDGHLTFSGGQYFFQAASAQFRASHADNRTCLRVQNCGNLGNNLAIFEIIAVMNTTTVILNPIYPPITPDHGASGSLAHPTMQWELLRLYTDQPPTRACYDDLNVELMQDIVGPTKFLMDKYCWETDFIETFSVNITSVTPGVSSTVPILYTVQVTGILQGTGNYSTARVVGIPDAWKITDNAATDFFVESMPVFVSGTAPEIYTLTVSATIPPVTGVGSMTYLCRLRTDCDYCKSSTILTTLT